MSAQGEPEPDDERAVRLRWIARAVVAAIGLWFLVDGLRGVWSDLGPLAQVLIVGAGVVALVVVALLLLRVDRSRRQG